MLVNVTNTIRGTSGDVIQMPDGSNSVTIIKVRSSFYDPPGPVSIFSIFLYM
ncbi:hypothetical protein K438DRAFT_1969296 [Mycena galopus ATCC 62051]|nr:hypothetical protein K438DRAFT_1969296 [Mycena galopus ATCC 62051]